MTTPQAEPNGCKCDDPSAMEREVGSGDPWRCSDCGGVVPVLPQTWKDGIAHAQCDLKNLRRPAPSGRDPGGEG